MKSYHQNIGHQNKHRSYGNHAQQNRTRNSAQRIARFASVVGKESVIASTDCGFGTSAAGDDLHPDVAWAKLGALAEGAKIASRELFKRG